MRKQTIMSGLPDAKYWSVICKSWSGDTLCLNKVSSFLIKGVTASRRNRKVSTSIRHMALYSTRSSYCSCRTRVSEKPASAVRCNQPRTQQVRSLLRRLAWRWSRQIMTVVVANRPNATFFALFAWFFARCVNKKIKHCIEFWDLQPVRTGSEYQALVQNCLKKQTGTCQCLI